MIPQLLSFVGPKFTCRRGETGSAPSSELQRMRTAGTLLTLAPGRKGTVVGGAVRGSGSGPGALGCPRHAHTFARCPFPDPPRSWDSLSSGFWALRPYQGSSTRVP